MSTIQIIISASTEITEILVAELGEIGFDIFEDSDQGLCAYCPEELFDQDSLEEIISRYQFLGQITYVQHTIEKQNWNEVWEKNYEPIRISNKVFIRASFHKPESGYQVEIVINPKMSFGTGHHETTSMMSEALFSLDLKGKSVLDAGTGTGILAFIAKKLGAAVVKGFDIDAWSVENSIENALLNACPEIEFTQSTVREHPIFEYDVLLANINRNILLDEMEEYAARITSGGFLLLSGFYTQDIPSLVKVANKNNLNLFRQFDKNNWACLILTKI
jgi:ribosomal protein L11 methyltransferase